MKVNNMAAAVFMKSMPVRREVFARLIAQGDVTATEAAARLGYCNPGKQGSRMKRAPNVQQYVAQIRSQLRTPAEALQDHVDTLTELRD